MLKKSMNKKCALILSAAIMSTVGFSAIPVMAATADQTGSSNEIFEIYDKYSEDLKDGEVLAPNPAADNSSTVKTILMKKNTKIIINGKALHSKGYLYRGTVNGKKKTVAMVPMSAVSKSLKAKVSKTSDGWNILYEDMNANIYSGDDMYSYTSAAAIGATGPIRYGKAPMVKNHITYIPANVFKTLLNMGKSRHMSMKINTSKNLVTIHVKVRKDITYLSQK